MGAVLPSRLFTRKQRIPDRVSDRKQKNKIEKRTRAPFGRALTELVNLKYPHFFWKPHSNDYPQVILVK